MTSALKFLIIRPTLKHIGRKPGDVLTEYGTQIQRSVVREVGALTPATPEMIEAFLLPFPIFDFYATSITQPNAFKSWGDFLIFGNVPF